MKEEGNQDIELERERETGEKNGLLARLLRDRMSSIEESSYAPLACEIEERRGTRGKKGNVMKTGIWLLSIFGG